MIFINKKIVALAGTIIGLCAITGIVVGGYFLISKSNKYSNYYSAPTNDSNLGLINGYKNAVYNGAEIVLAPGFTHATPIKVAFQDYPDFFKDTGFLLYDDKLSETDVAKYNTWSITFRADLGSIQTGIAMCMFLNEYQDVFLENDGKLKYGMYGGLPFSSVTSFMGGIQKGVEWFNTNVVRKDTSKYKEVELIKSNIGDFAGGFGPSQGSELASNLLANKADVIVPIAGPQVWNVMNIIQERNYKSVILGVDSAMENDYQNKDLKFTSSKGKVGNGKYVQFSSLKDLSLATQKVLRIINNGGMLPSDEELKQYNETSNDYKGFYDTSSKRGGFGTVAIGNMENGCVKVSDAGLPFYEQALQISGKSIDWTSPIYNDPNNMVYIGSDDKPLNYGKESEGGIAQEFKSITIGEENKVLNKKNLITKDNQKDKDKMRVVLSTSTSVLMDSSFSQSCYEGLYYYYQSMGIDIPPTSNTKSISNFNFYKKNEEEI